ncbi:MAG: acylphosphatase [Lachnospiraceae bacterium]|nr:acylphosphatase [Lachnospiraceae bacterium]
MKVRKHFYFSGRVQGVGFRWQAHRICLSLGLTGYVQNLWDGRVEMEAQGEQELVDKLLATLRQQPYIRIEDVEIRDMPLKEDKGFWMAY